MTRLRTIALAAAALAFAAVLPPAARADLWDKKTIVTFPESVETPSGVLPPGKYVFKLADSLSNRHIVQIFNDRENRVQATVLAIPAYRDRPADKSIFTFYEMPSGQPQALKTWFYPGDTAGQEFAYPKRRSVEIAALTGQQPASNEFQSRTPLPPPPPPVKEPEPQPSEEETSSNAAAPPEPIQMAQNRPPEQRAPESPAAPAPPAPAAPQPSGDAHTLPKTASEWPLFALLGVFSLGGAALLRVARRARRSRA